MKPAKNDAVLNKILDFKNPSDNFTDTLSFEDEVFTLDKQLMVKNPFTDKVQSGKIDSIGYLGTKKLENAYLIVEVPWDDQDPRLNEKNVKRQFVDHVVVHVKTFYNYCKLKNIQFWQK